MIVRVYCAPCGTGHTWRAKKAARVAPFCPRCQQRLLAPWDRDYARVRFVIAAAELVEWLRRQQYSATPSEYWALPSYASVLRNLEDYGRRLGREVAHQAYTLHRHRDLAFEFDTDATGRPLS